MGTNYYARKNECDKCNRYDEIHLGKSSAGWKFTFQYNEGQYYKNFDEMKKWLKDKNIYDEYGDKISYKEFFEMVKIKQDNNKNKLHSNECSDDMDSFLIGGYSFTDCDFC